MLGRNSWSNDAAGPRLGPWWARLFEGSRSPAARRPSRPQQEQEAAYDRAEDGEGAQEQADVRPKPPSCRESAVGATGRAGEVTLTDRSQVVPPEAATPPRRRAVQPPCAAWRGWRCVPSGSAGWPVRWPAFATTIRRGGSDAGRRTSGCPVLVTTFRPSYLPPNSGETAPALCDTTEAQPHGHPRHAQRPVPLVTSRWMVIRERCRPQAGTHMRARRTRLRRACLRGKRSSGPRMTIHSPSSQLTTTMSPTPPAEFQSQ